MGPMEIVRVITVVLGTLKIAAERLNNHIKLERVMKIGLEKLMNDLDYLKRGLEEDGWKSYDELLLTELVYDIEDFAQDLSGPRASDYLLSAIGKDHRQKYVDRIKFFQEELDKLGNRQQKSTESKSDLGGGSSSAAPAGRYSPVESLVGITEPKDVIEDLLKKPPVFGEQSGGQDANKPPKVISIVGCPGVGKTALARAVYDQYVASAAPCDFDCVAWVEAAGCNDTATLLGRILQQVQADLATRAGALQKLLNLVREVSKRVWKEDDDTAGALRGILADKRYLVFIDDLQQAKVLKDIIHDHFPENVKSGMVIVTTSVHQVANVCSSGSYVYKMKCLDDIKSEKLFCRQAFRNNPEDVGSARLAGSKSIITKCDGLPLALVSVAEHLCMNARNTDRDYCDKMAKEIGCYLVGTNNIKEEFMKLRSALGQCYETLPDYDHKTYMRSLSIFPRNHHIKCKSLERRSVAEGLVAGDGIARGCLDELVDRCIVEPVQISNCSKDVKSCRVNAGIMLEFIIQKSLSTNFVTLIREEEVVHNRNGRIRRLSVQSSTRDKFQEVAQEYKMSETIRSLTVIPSGGATELSEIKSYKFLRLLDLEDCKGLDEKIFSGICRLVYLKYLNLRRTDVKKIPRQIGNLTCLQTLDVRETWEIRLPIQVITLPKLAFLFGKFVLPKMSNDTKEFLEQKSELHTIAGLVVHKQGFEHIILKAKNLRKVKIWCRDTCAPPPAPSASLNLQTSNNDFVLCLQNRFTSLDSVSIHSDELSQDIMASLEGRPCKISRMKLWGKLVRLPSVATLRMLNTLNKLQLSYTGLTSDDLSVLQHIRCLEYLKLQDNQTNSWDGSFSVHRGGFESLRRLCFQALKLPKFHFEAGSMRSLTSLHLLCRDISQMQVAEEISDSIKHITSLDEVTLHYSATREIVESWKTAAKTNPSRPYVSQLLQR